MTDYGAMSDSEINVMVAAKLGVNAKCEDGCLFTSKKHAGDNVISVTTVTDYCNNPSGAWPIIDDIFSTLVSTGKYDDGIGFGEREMTIWQAQMHKNNCGKLRAAMIVFLMMNKDK